MHNKAKHNGFAIVLSWPDTQCKQAGGWYEPLMKLLKFSKNGYYKVGHAAIVLISDQSGECRYFDFGRYHAPHGFGRIRDQFTDHDLVIKTQATIDQKGILLNTDDILAELYKNRSCHGTGYIYSTTVRINIDSAKKRIQRLQKRTFMPYGPLEWNGTNCSRFVANVLNHSKLSFVKRLRLNMQVTVSASPKGNILAMNEEIIFTGKEEKQKELILSGEDNWAIS